ncbi:MAG: alpha/beta hydrolase [Pseudozobellia sp.]|nr:alpha/beta hydrolase [Pseudozobellia sp.]MBG48672.1 alpha/beta hydrolase [Pseudozobellia sp.]MBG50703.1 alpha/beta hydrolase [Pseudozobellia sp.]|tara:strand:- start:2412 stop:3824 length:1413 start_codon:yes stop_codon:yes gene_type:complete
MKQILTVLALGFTITCYSQKIVLKKGIIIDSLVVNDSITESYSLYLPTDFEIDRPWPVAFVFDMQGRGSRSLRMFKDAAEEHGYILAAPNNLSDTLSISDNVLATQRMFNTVVTILPIHQNQIYAAGFGSGGKYATLVPTFLKSITGVVACGTSLANTEILTSKNPYRFINIVGNADYNYMDVQQVESTLNRMRFPNQILAFEGGHEWPPSELLSDALGILTMNAMAKGFIDKDDEFVNQNYRKNLASVSTYVSANRPLLAESKLSEMMEIYSPFRTIDSVKDSRKVLRKTSRFKVANRSQTNNFLKEQFLREDYAYYMEEDLLTYNYNNLGWWKYQTEEIQKFKKNPDVLINQMGFRLEGYVNALLADNIDMVKDAKTKDVEGLNFLYMMKTILQPEDHDAYLQVISLSSELDDYGAALFYLEELLKRGYVDKARLYNLDNTALLRITPEFNELVERYLKNARYEIIQE